MNILDYIDWRGDIEFSYKPFNAVDNLILSELAYVNMDGILDSTFSFDVTLSNLLAKYRVARLDQKGAGNNPIPLLEKAAYAERYKNITLSGYVNKIDDENATQFSAVTFKIDNDTIYVAFRGTDHTMTGWHEDFNFGYLDETPGQKMAVKYLENVCEKTQGKIYVGGHSKGGNLAVYAAAFANCDLKTGRLINVFSNDGPGFKKSITESESYKSITGKIIKIVPEASIIGMILFGSEPMHIIVSDGKGMDQHSPYKWHVKKDSFVLADELKYSSEVLDEILDKWIDCLPDDKRGIVIETLFSAIDAAGYTSMRDIMDNKISAYNAIAKASKTLDEDERKITMDSLKMMASISKDVLWDDAKNKFMRKK